MCKAQMSYLAANDLSKLVGLHLLPPSESQVFPDLATTPQYLLSNPIPKMSPQGAYTVLPETEPNLSDLPHLPRHRGLEHKLMGTG
jgi:hypothetical protein